MKKPLKAVLGCLTGLIACSCGTQYPLLADISRNHMADLQEHVQAREIGSPEQMKADSLNSVAITLLQKGKRKEAYALSDRARIYYRLALAEADLKDAEKKASNLQQSLVDTEEQLRMYGKVLSELKQMETE